LEFYISTNCNNKDLFYSVFFNFVTLKINKRLTFEEQLEQAKNIKFLSDSEYTELKEYWNKYQEAISVDAFDKL